MPKKLDRRPLMMKWRVRPTRRMKVRTLLRLLKQAIRTGYLPDGIELMEMDWAKGKGRRMNAGEIPGDALHDMRAFYQALRASTIRVSRVEE